MHAPGYTVPRFLRRALVSAPNPVGSMFLFLLSLFFRAVVSTLPALYFSRFLLLLVRGNYCSQLVYRLTEH